MSGATTGEAAVLRHRQGRLEVLTLHRPAKANALNREALELIDDAVRRPEDDVAAVIIRAEGRVFSGGVDLGDVRESAGLTSGRPVQELLDEVVTSIQDSPVPVVALVQGACVGGAVELALSCDLRVATPMATFRVPATQIGVVYRARGVSNLGRSLPVDTLRQLLLIGATFDSSAALRSGIVDMVVADPDPLAALEATLARLTTCPDTFAAQKAVIRSWSQHIAPPPDVMAHMTRIREGHDDARRRDPMRTASGSTT